VWWLVLRAAVMFVGGGVAQRVLGVFLPDGRLPLPVRAQGERSTFEQVRCPPIQGKKAGSFLSEVETDGVGVLLGLRRLTMVRAFNGVLLHQLRFLYSWTVRLDNGHEAQAALPFLFLCVFVVFLSCKLFFSSLYHCAGNGLTNLRQGYSLLFKKQTSSRFTLCETMEPPPISVTLSIPMKNKTSCVSCFFIKNIHIKIVAIKLGSGSVLH
jgi:hypothetical protein